MSKSGHFGMAFHQAISFSRAFTRVGKGCDSIFWPGCALMNMDTRIVLKCLEILRREVPGMQLSSCCCGQPGKYLFAHKHPQHMASLKELLEKRGIRHIYTACPNCTRELREMGYEVHPIWTVLAKQIRPEDIRGRENRCTLHDPCPMRHALEQQQAVRALMALAGTEIVEPRHSGKDTVCCGNIRMLRATNPEMSARMRRLRISEFEENIPVSSYCEGCLDAFRSEGLETVHILEVLFGRSEKRSWANRIKLTLGVT